MYLKYRVWFTVRYWILPMAFTAEQRHSFSGLPYACDEVSHRHVPWIPASSLCEILQLAPQRFDEERSIRSATSTCSFRTVGSQSHCRVLNLMQLPFGSYPLNQWGIVSTELPLRGTRPRTSALPVLNLKYQTSGRQSYTISCTLSSISNTIS